MKEEGKVRTRVPALYFAHGMVARIAIILFVAALGAACSGDQRERIDAPAATYRLFAVEPAAGASPADASQRWQIALITGVDSRSRAFAELTDFLRCDGARMYVCQERARRSSTRRKAVVLSSLGWLPLDAHRLDAMREGDTLDANLGGRSFQSALDARGALGGRAPARLLAVRITLVRRCPVALFDVTERFRGPPSGDVIARHRDVTARWIEAEGTCLRERDPTGAPAAVTVPSGNRPRSVKQPA